jgi:hypothetical protein
LRTTANEINTGNGSMIYADHMNPRQLKVRATQFGPHYETFTV